MKEKNEIPYEYDKEKWIDIIQLGGFEESSIDKIHEYIDNHVRYELQYPLLFKEKLEESSLPLALKVLSILDKKDLLDRFVFVSQTSGKVVVDEKEYNFQISACDYQFSFKNDGVEMIPNKSEYFTHEFINTTADQFEAMLSHDDEPVFVFVLFARTIMPEPYQFKVFHRYYQPKENGDEK